MKIRTTDIPAGGRELGFDYNLAALNARLDQEHRRDDPHNVAAPNYRFVGKPQADLKIVLEGSTVELEGRARASFITVCSRCAEETKQDLDVPVHLILKPGSDPAAAGRLPSREELEAVDEDLNFGFYFNGEVDCDVSTQDFLILSLPYTALCSENCKGLCPNCGANLNTEPCRCKHDAPHDDRFAVLKNLKIN